MEKLTLHVKVQPKARKAGLEKIGADSFRARVSAAPEKGAANREVSALIAAYFKVPVSRVQIVRGVKSRIKLVDVFISDRIPEKGNG